MNEPTRSTEPRTRLDKIAARALESIQEEDVKAIIMLGDAEGYTVALGGYEGDQDALVDLIMHFHAIMKANGKELALYASSGDSQDVAVGGPGVKRVI